MISLAVSFMHAAKFQHRLKMPRVHCHRIPWTPKSRLLRMTEGTLMGTTIRTAERLGRNA
jgi:hypothetical protein